MRCILRLISRHTLRSLTTIWRKSSTALSKSASKSSSFPRLIWPNRTFSMTTDSRFTSTASLMSRSFKQECLGKSSMLSRSSRSTGNATFSIKDTRSLEKRAVASQLELMFLKYTSAAKTCMKPKTVNQTEWTGIFLEIYSRSRTSAWTREANRRASTSHQS